MAELNGRAGMSTDDGQRQIIDNLLPQIGITGNIDAAEKPVDAIKRLRQMSENAAHSKALDTCLRWFNKPQLVSTQITGVHVVSTG